MSNPAFFVDGQTEQRSLHNICPGNPIRIIGCNGDNVSIDAIAKRLTTLIKVLNNKYYPIVILIDREGRTDKCEKIAIDLRDALIQYGVKDEILIGVCDRMIENWMLADVTYINSKVKGKNKLGNESLEGTNGKAILKKLIPEYHETSDGVNLLTNANVKSLYERSHSFKTFANLLRPIKCQWLGQIGFEAI